MREQKKEQSFKAFLREKEKEENFGLTDKELMEKIFDEYKIHVNERRVVRNYILQKLKEQKREREREYRRNYAEQGLLFKENPENPLPENRNFGFGPPR